MFIYKYGITIKYVQKRSNRFNDKKIESLYQAHNQTQAHRGCRRYANTCW